MLEWVLRVGLAIMRVAVSGRGRFLVKGIAFAVRGETRGRVTATDGAEEVEGKMRTVGVMEYWGEGGMARGVMGFEGGVGGIAGS